MKQLAKRLGVSQALLRSTLESALVAYMNQVTHDVDLRGLTTWFQSQDPKKFPQRQLTTDEKLDMLEHIQAGRTVGEAEALVRGYTPDDRQTTVGRAVVRAATMSQYFTDDEIDQLDQLDLPPQEALDKMFPDMFTWSDK